MAARKEILDFIMLERTETPPTHEDVQAHALRITDIYNDRKADLLTLKNDLFELVSESKIYERMGAKHTTPDFEEAIMMLLMTATDWELFLPETEVQRYEKVRLNVIENLADYIRETYSHHQMQHGTLTPATQTPQVEASKTMPPNTQSDTPPAPGQMGEVWQEQETPTKLKRKRGRPQKEFEDFFITPDDAPKVISILEKLLKGKFGRDAARIIVACYHGGWITEPTPASIERKFGIGASGLKEPLRCHFAPPAHSNPKFPKFTNEELSPIVEKIQLEVASTPQQ